MLGKQLDDNQCGNFSGSFVLFLSKVSELFKNISTKYTESCQKYCNIEYNFFLIEKNFEKPTFTNL